MDCSFEFYEVNILLQIHELSSLKAFIISIEQLSHLPSFLSIGMGCLISLLFKLFAIICIIVVTHAIALKTKNSILTSFIAVLLFLVPILLTYGNYHIFDSISLYPLLMNGQYVMDNQGIMQILYSFVGYLLLMICSLKFIDNSYKA